jgi:hypothetical protein
VDKHPTTRLTDNLLSAPRACPNCGIENVSSVGASETTKKERVVSHKAFSDYEVAFRITGCEPGIARGA